MRVRKAKCFCRNIDGNYFRTFRITEIVDRSKITASITDGVLKLVLPKVEKLFPAKFPLPAASRGFRRRLVLWVSSASFPSEKFSPEDSPRRCLGARPIWRLFLAGQWDRHLAGRQAGRLSHLVGATQCGRPGQTSRVLRGTPYGPRRDFTVDSYLVAIVMLACHRKWFPLAEAARSSMFPQCFSIQFASCRILTPARQCRHIT